MTITRHTQTFLDAAHRVSRGEITRIDAASALDIKPGTFAVWMSRAGIGGPKNERGTKQLAGAALGWALTDPDKVKDLDDATALVLSGECSQAEALLRYPSVKQTTLSIKVTRARARAGIPVKKRAPRGANTTTPAPK